LSRQPAAYGATARRSHLENCYCTLGTGHASFVKEDGEIKQDNPLPLGKRGRRAGRENSRELQRAARASGAPCMPPTEAPRAAGSHGHSSRQPKVRRNELLAPASNRQRRKTDDDDDDGGGGGDDKGRLPSGGPGPACEGERAPHARGGGSVREDPPSGQVRSGASARPRCMYRRCTGD